MTTDKIIKTAQAHFTKNWKTYAILLGVLVLWANRHKIGKMLGLSITKPIPETDPKAKAINEVTEISYKVIDPQTGTATAVTQGVTQDVTDIVKKIEANFGENVYLFDSERCEVVSELAGKTDAQLIVIDQVCRKAKSGKSLYMTLYDIFNDPCAWLPSNLGGESEYDKLLTRLLKLTEKTAA